MIFTSTGFTFVVSLTIILFLKLVYWLTQLWLLLPVAAGVPLLLSVDGDVTGGAKLDTVT